MRILLAAILLCLLGIIHPVSTGTTVLPEDLEVSGYDEDEGSGSGDLSEKVSLEGNRNVKGQPDTEGEQRFTVKKDGSADDSHGFSDRAFDDTFWSAEETVVAKSKTIFENKETQAGIIAGGVTGMLMAVTLAGLLIYKLQKKDNGGYILGQQGPPVGECRRPHEDEVVVV